LIIRSFFPATFKLLESALVQSRQAECDALLYAISMGKIEATIAHFTLHEVCGILDDSSRAAEFLRLVESPIGFRVFDTALSEEIAIAILAEKIGLDFEDTLQYFVARKVGAKSIVSFDKHLNKVDIARKEPSQILAKL
jgi:predicted nucleic acid-binding protein